MTTEQPAKFRDELNASQAEPRTSLEEPATHDSKVRPGKAIGSLARQDAKQAQRMVSEVRHRDSARRRQFMPVIRRGETGDYGVCAGREEEIPPMRLPVRAEGWVRVRRAEIV